MLSAKIEITEDIENIKKLFKADNFNAKTAKVDLIEKEKKIIFTIKSKDIISLRASLNGLTTMLSIYHKTKQKVD